VNQKVSVHEHAELELNDAAVFFETKREGLGLRFLSAFEAALAHIRKHPEASPLIIKNIRRKVLRGFPYSVLYSIKSDRIRILAVANQRRRPFYWRGRT
jgi:plasmid stabilization system protein ParE